MRLPLLALGVCLLLAPPLLAQERKPRPPRPEEDPERFEPLPELDPDHAVEFWVGGDGLGLGYRTGHHRRRGFASLGLFASEDDDLVLEGRLMRFGQPAGQPPLGLGIGLGLLGAEVDEPNDEVLAITLIGAADYAFDRAFDLSYPVRAGIELSYAPAVATFLDGTRVLGIQGRVEMDLSTWATAFVGYRSLELDLENEDDAEVDRAVHAGVRLGF